MRDNRGLLTPNGKRTPAQIPRIVYRQFFASLLAMALFLHQTFPAPVARRIAPADFRLSPEVFGDNCRRQRLTALPPATHRALAPV